MRRYYANNKSVQFIDEPVSVWESIKDKTGKNMIEKFYADQTKYAFSFQIMALSSRIQYIQNAIAEAKNTISRGEATEVVLVMERSIKCDEYVFAELLRASGNMEDVEHQIYKLYATSFVEGEFIPSTILWLDTPPSVCMANISKRNRLGEDALQFKYITSCHDAHTTWLTTKNNYGKSNVVRILNFNEVNLNDNNDNLVSVIARVWETPCTCTYNKLDDTNAIIQTEPTQ